MLITKANIKIYLSTAIAVVSIAASTARAAGLYPYAVNKSISTIKGIQTFLDFSDVGQMESNSTITETDPKTLSGVWLVPQYVTLSVQDSGQTMLKVTPYRDTRYGGYGVTIDMLLRTGYKASTISMIEQMAPQLNHYYPMASKASFSAITIGNDNVVPNSLSTEHVQVIVPDDPFSVVGMDYYFQVRLTSIGLNAWRCAQDLLDRAKEDNDSAGYDSLSILTGHAKLEIPTYTYQSARYTPANPENTQLGATYTVPVNVDELATGLDVSHGVYIKQALQRFALRMKQFSQQCNESKNRIPGQSLSTYHDVKQQFRMP